MPGAGKSNALVNIAHKALAQGRQVYSNIAIKGCNKIEFTDLIEFRFPRNSVILLDEAGRNFNARDWKNLPPDIFDLFTLHRHLGLDMFIAVQDFGMIDINLRRVIELTWWIVNYDFLPFYIHKGYYNLENLGKMGRPDLTQIIWKRRKVRQRYDHTSMKHVFASKEVIPDKPWFPFPFHYKGRMKTAIQIIRIKIKRTWFKHKHKKKMKEGLINA
jgi:zona occludens toxin (predicted ATPase)